MRRQTQCGGICIISFLCVNIEFLIIAALTVAGGKVTTNRTEKQRCSMLMRWVEK